MIKYIYLFCLLFFFISFTSCDENNEAEIFFSESLLEFNAIQGEQVTKRFIFTNQGNDSLVILSVHASCGCTIANYSKKKIAAGEQGVIEVIYDSSEDTGTVKKEILVESNTTPALTRLSIVGSVNTP